MHHWIVTGAASGIGRALAIELATRRDDVALILSGRDSARLQDTLSRLPTGHAHRARTLTMDLTDEPSCQEAVRELADSGVEVQGVINAVGFLHGDDISPEKRIEDFSIDSLQRNIAVNAAAFAVLTKHVYKLMPRSERCVLASLSARVGSISDNRLGGWYSYRASKAAHNMLVRGLSIELGRRYKQMICIGLHPGTVDTDLSKPFQRGVPDDKLFSPAQSAGYLLDVIESRTPEDSGKVFDWAGQEIPA